MTNKQTNQPITFSFGKNWQNYLATVTDREIESARSDIEEWLGPSGVRGKTVIDIGSGSGIHSLAFLRLGARHIHSLDYDKHSVEATMSLWRTEGRPANWVVEHGSILDRDYIRSLGRFDIVYSWGVLHHTGALWQAMSNASNLVRPGGTLWISLYRKSPSDEKDVALKRKYNTASYFGKRIMEGRRIAKLMLSRARHLQNPFAWNQKGRRGMNVYHDIIDWLGGLPYETASECEVVTRARKRGFILERIKVAGPRGCSTYVFSLPAQVARTSVPDEVFAPSRAAAPTQVRISPLCLAGACDRAARAAVRRRRFARVLTGFSSRSAADSAPGRAPAPNRAPRRMDGPRLLLPSGAAILPPGNSRHHRSRCAGRPG